MDRTGEYADFWTEHVPEESTPEQLAELLDGIAERFEKYRPFMVGDVGRMTWLSQLPVKLLDRVLKDTRWSNPGGNVAVKRLYEWLGVVSDPDLRLPDWQTGHIRFDLEWNAGALKELIAYGAETCLRRGDQCKDLVDRRLFGARPRMGYGQWCLDMALAAEKSKATAFYLQELLGCVTDRTRADWLTIDDARGRLAVDDALMRQFDEMLASRSCDGAQTEHPPAPAPAAERELAADTAEQLTWQAEIEAQATELRSGRGEPDLLHRAAEAYLGVHDDSAGKTPRQRLGDLIGRRGDLIDLLLAGMEGTIARKDLPGCDDVVRLFDRNRVNLLVLPFVAGLHSLEQAGNLSDGDLTENRTRLAVTILYTLPWLFDLEGSVRTGMYRPAWFRTVLSDSPELVADVLRHSVARKLETGVQRPVELYELANAEDHREVATLISLSVLENFPKAETDMALQGLCWALNAALKSCDWSAVQRVIEERLGRSGLGERERGCWLAVAFLMTPGRYRQELRALAEDRDCLKALAMFVGAGRFPREFTQHFDGDHIVALVAALGAALRRDGLPERAYWSMTDLIGTLGDNPSAAATEAIEELSRESNAEPWEPAIADARERQARKRREHEYQHGDIGKVVHTLDGGAPANAGDLAALVFEELTALSLKIRDGSTSDWRQYWNVFAHSQPVVPRPEDACRDTLLSDLQARVEQLGIDAQPEGRYADQKRSDIRAYFGGFNVPVEIKRSCHRDLWTAIKTQLIPKYTRDPGAAGFGIYLVFWFGHADRCTPTGLDGWTPPDAAAVKAKLTELLSDQEKQMISVCVIDVARPNS